MNTIQGNTRAIVCEDADIYHLASEVFPGRQHDIDRVDGAWTVMPAEHRDASLAPEDALRYAREVAAAAVAASVLNRSGRLACATPHCVTHEPHEGDDDVHVAFDVTESGPGSYYGVQVIRRVDVDGARDDWEVFVSAPDVTGDVRNIDKFAAVLSDARALCALLNRQVLVSGLQE